MTDPTEFHEKISLEINTYITEKFDDAFERGFEHGKFVGREDKSGYIEYNFGLELTKALCQLRQQIATEIESWQIPQPPQGAYANPMFEAMYQAQVTARTMCSAIARGQQ